MLYPNKKWSVRKIFLFSNHLLNILIESSFIHFFFFSKSKYCSRFILILSFWLSCLQGIKNTEKSETISHAPKKGLSLGMTLNCIWRWGSTSWPLENVENPFIAFTLGYKLTLFWNACQIPMYALNISVWKLFVLDDTWNRIIWNPCVKKNQYWFYGIVGYLMPNPVYICILNI